MSDVTEREYRQAREYGAQAFRGGRPIGSCPYRGSTPKVRKLAEAWRLGYEDAKAERRRRA